MKKRTSKIFAAVMTLVMVLAMTAMMTGCGGEKTLEGYFADNPEQQEALDKQMAALKQAGTDVKVEIKENAVIYSYQFEETLTEEQAEQLTEVFKTYTDSFGPTFEGIAKSLETETEIDGITCQVIYKNGDGSDLYNKTFEAAE